MYPCLLYHNFIKIGVLKQINTSHFAFLQSLNIGTISSLTSVSHWLLFENLLNRKKMVQTAYLCKLGCGTPNPAHGRHLHQENIFIRLYCVCYWLLRPTLVDRLSCSSIRRLLAEAPQNSKLISLTYLLAVYYFTLVWFAHSKCLFFLKVLYMYSI